jgi:hypothetical protein
VAGIYEVSNRRWLTQNHYIINLNSLIPVGLAPHAVTGKVGLFLKQQMQKLKDIEAQLQENPTNKLPSPILMHAQRPRAAEAPEWSATTSRE